MGLFQMTFEGADDNAFTTGVVTLVLEIWGADTPLENEGDEQTAWDHRKGVAAVHRRKVVVYWRPATVIANTTSGTDLDHGHYEAFCQLLRKPYKRISDTNLPRVTRIFEGDGSLGDPFSLWDGRDTPTEVAGLLPFVFEAATPQLPKWDNTGRMAITSELFAPNVEAA